MQDIQKMLGKLRKAVDDYEMINEGDKIAVGVSGGKDSLTLLLTLKKLQNFYPKKFDLVGITLGMGIGNADFSPIKNFCEEHEIEYYFEDTNIGKILFEERMEKNPCSLCANLRRGALNNAAEKLGCNVVALGHHRDDVIETLIMSLFYEGRIHTFSPVTHLSRKNLYVIRPLIYTEEKDIKTFVKKLDLPIVKSVCEFDGKTTRQDMKDLLFELMKKKKDIKSNIFGAIKRSSIDNWNSF